VSYRHLFQLTHLTLQSGDVIHSFWLPQLNGETDLISNRQNETWLDPYETGVYFGNCAAVSRSMQTMLLRVGSCILRRDFKQMGSRAKAGAFFRPLAQESPRSTRDALRAWVHDPQILKPAPTCRTCN
jgi:hypothetical protein